MKTHRKFIYFSKQVSIPVFLFLVGGLKIFSSIFFDVDNSKSNDLDDNTEDPSLAWGDTQDDGWID